LTVIRAEDKGTMNEKKVDTNNKKEKKRATRWAVTLWVV
jgi:hypothetical protein